MNKRYRPLLLVCLLLGACSTMPTGPNTMALPGSGKNYDEFRRDDWFCQREASEQIGVRNAERAADERAASGAVLGTVIGAVAGAALGGRDGAAAGAGVGLIAGSAAGANAAQQTAWTAQRRYDNAYVQCMYAHGHRVPSYDRAQPTRGHAPRYAPPPPPPPRYDPPPPRHYVPPPPAGLPPPPPPDY